MFITTTANTTQDLQQILTLQQENLVGNIDSTEMNSQGFVTLQHNLGVLQQMHDLAPSIVVKDNDTVVAYALVMLPACRQLVPSLEPMFALLDQMQWNNKPLNSYTFYVMGQVCVGKAYRGQGLFDMLYNKHKEIYAPQYELLVTEVSTRNHRSMRAHERVGFKTIHTYRDELDEWAVVVWDWREQ